jgi:polysaccharide export outer membrane protein
VYWSHRLRTSLLVALSALGACQASLPLLPTETVGKTYQLGTGDQVRITTFGEKDLSGEFRVDDSGYVALPLIGPVTAEGLTTRELSEAVKHTLQTKHLVTDPSVVVEVVQYRPIFVLGEVQHPGPYPYQARMTFLNAVALAGGFTPRSIKNDATVVRTTPHGVLKGRIDQVKFLNLCA